MTFELTLEFKGHAKLQGGSWETGLMRLTTCYMYTLILSLCFYTCIFIPFYNVLLCLLNVYICSDLLEHFVKACVSRKEEEEEEGKNELLKNSIAPLAESLDAK